MNATSENLSEKSSDNFSENLSKNSSDNFSDNLSEISTEISSENASAEHADTENTAATLRDAQIREQLIHYGNALISHGLTKGTGGNLSFFDRQNQVVYITPSGIPFEQIEPDDIVLMGLDGQVIRGTRKASSEWAMHLIFYRNREDISAVIHAHTTYSTAIACLRETLPASHYMLSLAGPDVRCAEYQSFGTEALAKAAFSAMVDRKAVLLANHGILAGERSLAGAFNVLEEVEYCAKIHILARSIGQPVIIDEGEMAAMSVKFQTYGQPFEEK